MSSISATIRPRSARSVLARRGRRSSPARISTMRSPGRARSRAAVGDGSGPRRPRPGADGGSSAGGRAGLDHRCWPGLGLVLVSTVGRRGTGYLVREDSDPTRSEARISANVRSRGRSIGASNAMRNWGRQYIRQTVVHSPVWGQNPAKRRRRSASVSSLQQSSAQDDAESAGGFVLLLLVAVPLLLLVMAVRWALTAGTKAKSRSPLRSAGSRPEAEAAPRHQPGR